MQLIKNTDKEYPKLLKNIKKSPQLLYAKGDISILNSPSITVIGSRNMSEYGEMVTRKIVKDLTISGMCIVSGMAVGIDSIAHKTCLENGGKTVAVLGSGLNKIFPPENKDLLHKIIKQGGCVLSEYPPDISAQKSFFVQRNRIVSGLSMATLVIEATYRSGTSITANCALNQGRKLFCIPNSIGNKNSAGIINWLKKGAKLVTNAEEILYELGINSSIKNYEQFENMQKEKIISEIESEELKYLDDNCKNIYYYIKENKVINSEILSGELNMEIQTINSYLTILELKGLIVNVSGLNFKVSDRLYV